MEACRDKIPPEGQFPFGSGCPFFLVVIQEETCYYNLSICILKSEAYSGEQFKFIAGDGSYIIVI